MPDKPISALRQRMIDDMTARRFCDRSTRQRTRVVRDGHWFESP
jgi:hypothetical protein